MDPLLLRFIERLTAVLVGGMAIYLGYRLFLKVPEARDNSGRVSLPWNVSVVMSRVGPGVFFALFGAAAVGLSLLNPLRLPERGGQAGLVYAGGPAEAAPSARAEQRRLLKREINVLNSMPHQFRADLPLQDKEVIEAAIPRIKLLLIKAVWGTPDEGFGDFTEFESWMQRGELEPPPPAVAGAVELYRYGAPR